MFARLRHALIGPLGLCVLCASPRVEAQAEPSSQPAPVTVEARSARKLAATHGEDPSASGTSIDLTDRVTMPRSLSDVLRESPGVQVQSTGGAGAFSSLSLRGASSEETQVLLDEIPLTMADGGAFDLSLFPAELFAKVSTFRGGAPVWLGSGAIGGVLQLSPHRGERDRASASVGAGSFGTYQATAGLETALPHGMSANTQLVVRNTQGDYPYLNDGQTVWEPGDDREFRIKNADFSEASGLSDLTVPLWRGSLHVFALGLQRGGGFPGAAAAPTPKVRRESSRALTAAAYTLEGGAPGAFERKLQLVASGAYSADRFTDRHGQLGVSRRSDADNHTFRGFFRAAGALHWTRWLETSWVSSYALDAYLPSDSYVFPTPSNSGRHSVASAFELALRGTVRDLRVELRPSARLEWSRTELHASEAYRRAFPASNDLVAATARIGAVVAPHPALALSASIATGKRLPAIYELFGDGGLVLPSLDLHPVASTTYDGGVSVRGRLGLLHGRAELRGFYQERRNAIGMSLSAQRQVSHQNLPSVHQYGAESSLHGSLGELFHLMGSFTWLETNTSLDKRFPFMPRYTGYVRPELRMLFDQAAVSSASFSGELMHRGFVFINPSNQGFTAACTKVAFGAALGAWSERVRFSARMDDALDARCTDMLGYPLPGRSLFFTVGFQEVEFHES